MTVKELKEKLNQFDDRLLVMIPNIDWHPYVHTNPFVSAMNVAQGCNEADGCIFIDSYVEED